MPKILFIAAHRPDRSPSQRYRFEQYFDFFRSNGYEYELSYVINEKDDSAFYKSGTFLSKVFITLKNIRIRLSDVKRVADFDIVFVQREAFLMGSAYFEKRFAKSKAKLIFDFDDSIWLLDTSVANQKWKFLKSAKKIGAIISVSDMVFAGNSYLANYAKQFSENVVVIPTTIDTDKFKRNSNYQNNAAVCIGWSGSITTIKHFEQAIPVLKKIKNKYGDKVCFKVMGDPTYENKELDIKGIAWSSEGEVSVLESFDIGIMPLPNDEWVKGKCGLKGLSYMALEVPTIMSAVGVNTEIIKDGENGFVATSNEEWEEKLSRLINSFDLRKKMGETGRKTVVEKYSVESQKMNYLNNFNKLLTT